MQKCETCVHGVKVENGVFSVSMQANELVLMLVSTCLLTTHFSEALSCVAFHLCVIKCCAALFLVSVHNLLVKKKKKVVEGSQK